MSPVAPKGHHWHPKSAPPPSWLALSTGAMQHLVVAAGPGHLPRPGAPNQWGEPQAGPCTPNPPSPGEERQEKPPGTCGRAFPRKAASCGNVPPELASVVPRNAKITCPAAAAVLLAPQEPSPGDGGSDAVFSGVQTFWVMFALLWDHGERVPAGRGEGTGQKMHPLR